jgi:hypothetical protein
MVNDDAFPALSGASYLVMWTDTSQAQMMASEYKNRGGGYTTDKKDESAKHLDQWTEEEWQTKDGSGHAKKEDGTEQRYLPKKAWEQMSEKEKEETDAKKQKESREGKQYVVNTPKAKQARKNASKENDEKNGSQKDASSQRKDYTSAKNCTTHWEDPEHLERNLSEYKKFQEGNRKSIKDAEKKRSAASNGDSPNKKHKTNRDEPNGSAGSITRVPHVGQKVQWHSLPGYIDGEVVDVVYEEKEVDGKKVKASKEDPRIVLKSGSSGKICVHKPEAVYFE